MAFKKLTAINAETATKVSEVVNVRGAKRVTFMFTREHSSGNVVFTVQASLDRDGDKYVSSVPMIPATPNNASQGQTRTLSVTIAGEDTVIAALDLEHFCYESIKVKAEHTGSGTNYARVLVEY